MKHPHVIKSIESAATKRGVSVGDICILAKIQPITWQRWKAGDNLPNMRTWSRVETALGKLGIEV